MSGLKRNKLVPVVIFVCVMIIVSSCTDKNNPVSDINMETMLKTSALLSGSCTAILLNNDNLIKSADCLVLSYIAQERIKNNGTVLPNYYSILAALISTPEQVDNIKINNMQLVMNNPLVKPELFLMPSASWTGYDSRYQDRVVWNINLKNHKQLLDSGYFQEDLNYVHISCGDLLPINSEFAITWTPSKNNSNLWMDFTWMPDYNDSTNSEYFSGFKVEDNGKFTFGADDLTKMGVKSSGVLIFNLIRWKTYSLDNFNFGLKTVYVAVTESKVVVALTKQV